jgi:hypothetical protein
MTNESSRHSSMTLCCRYCGRALRQQPCSGRDQKVNGQRLIQAFSERCVCRLSTPTLFGLRDGVQEALDDYRTFLTNWYQRHGVLNDTTRSLVQKTNYPLLPVFAEDVRRELAHRESVEHGPKRMSEEADAEEKAADALDALFARHAFTMPQKTFLLEIAQKVGPETALLLAEGWAGEGK